MIRVERINSDHDDLGHLVDRFLCRMAMRHHLNISYTSDDEKKK